VQNKVLQCTRKIINLSTSLSIVSIQYGLPSLALTCLERAYRADLAFYELPRVTFEKLQTWRGRVVVLNTLAFFFGRIGDMTNALKFIYEAQKLLP